MPRPRKWRRVCCLPINTLYGPLHKKNIKDNRIVMSIEEYETVRLIDLEGFMQEEAAEQMKIARTTVQRIYNDARKKIAQSLVNGVVLKIEGGDYLLCDGLENICRCGGCHRHRLRGDYLNNESEDDKNENSNSD